MANSIDLHCHSTASDGTLAPAALVARARDQGLDTLALTDHDTVAGIPAARAAAAAAGLRLIAALELSTAWRDRPMHVVGLNVDDQAPGLRSLIARLGRLREERAERIGLRLERLGYPAALDGARRQADGALPTRSHFARHLLERGAVRDMNEAFKRFLGRGKPAYVRAEWPGLEETVATIRAAGGVAVLAHPHSYGWTGAWTRRILEAFVAAGGEGLEVCCGNSNRDQVLNFGGHARRFGLLASAGSDFHAPETPWIELGRYPPLPPDLTPVWSRWR